MGTTNNMFGFVVARLFHNEGNGRFKEVTTNLPTPESPDFRWEDFDRDGFPDLRISGVYYTNWSGYSIDQYFRNNNGDQTFTLVTTVVPPADPPGVPPGVIGDYDNNGLSDLLRTEPGPAWYSNYVRAYRGDPNANFTNLSVDLLVPAVHALGWADYDKDGDLDFYASGNDTSLYRNNSFFKNTAPQPPKCAALSRPRRISS